MDICHLHCFIILQTKENLVSTLSCTHNLFGRISHKRHLMACPLKGVWEIFTEMCIFCKDIQTTHFCSNRCMPHAPQTHFIFCTYISTGTQNYCIEFSSWILHAFYISTEARNWSEKKNTENISRPYQTKGQLRVKIKSLQRIRWFYDKWIVLLDRISSN